MKASVARGIVLSLAATAAFIGGDGCVVLPQPPPEKHAGLEGPTRVVIRGAPVVLEKGQVEDGNLVVVGASARVDGTVRGSLLVFGGSLDVGPEATVERDLVAVGNEHQQVAPSAKVAGSEVVADVPGLPSLLSGLLFVWDYPLPVIFVGFAALGLLGWLAWRRVVRRYDDERFHGTLAERPVRAGLIGLGLHVALWAAGLAAVLTGWLAGVGFALWFINWVAWLVGWTLCGVHLGRRLARRRSWKGSPAGHALAGIGLWLLLSLVPVVGWLAALLGSLVAFGALLAPQQNLAPTAPAIPQPAPEPLAVPAG